MKFGARRDKLSSREQVPLASGTIYVPINALYVSKLSFLSKS